MAQFEIFEVPFLRWYDYRFDSKDSSFSKSSRLMWNGCVINSCWIRHELTFPTIQCEWGYVRDTEAFRRTHMGEDPNLKDDYLVLRGIVAKDSMDYYRIMKNSNCLKGSSRKYLERIYNKFQKYKKNIEKNSVLYD